MGVMADPKVHLHEKVEGLSISAVTEVEWNAKLQINFYVRFDSYDYE